MLTGDSSELQLTSDDAKIHIETYLDEDSVSEWKIAGPKGQPQQLTLFVLISFALNFLSKEYSTQTEFSEDDKEFIVSKMFPAIKKWSNHENAGDTGYLLYMFNKFMLQFILHCNDIPTIKKGMSLIGQLIKINPKYELKIHGIHIFFGKGIALNNRVFNQYMQKTLETLYICYTSSTLNDKGMYIEILQKSIIHSILFIDEEADFECLNYFINNVMPEFYKDEILKIKAEDVINIKLPPYIVLYGSNEHCGGHVAAIIKFLKIIYKYLPYGDFRDKFRTKYKDFVETYYHYMEDKGIFTKQQCIEFVEPKLFSNSTFSWHSPRKN